MTESKVAGGGSHSGRGFSGSPDPSSVGVPDAMFVLGMFGMGAVVKIIWKKGGVVASFTSATEFAQSLVR